MEPGNFISKKTALVISIALFIAIIIAFIFAVLYTMDIPESERVFKNSIYLKFFFITAAFFCCFSYIISITTLSFSVGWSNKWLYFLSLLGISSIFCLVNASGGLTSSPFITLYSTLLTITIIVKRNFNAFLIQCIIVIFFITLHGILEQNGLPTKTTIENTPKYKFQYGAIVSVSFILVGLSDYTSKNSDKFESFINKFRKVDDV